MKALDRDALLERLRGIEWDDFEVKEAAGGVPKTAYTTVSAFANSCGGWLVFGVREAQKRYEIVGLADPDNFQNDFLGSCRSTEKFSRPVDVRPHHFQLEGKVVLAFYVAPAPRFDKPVRVRLEKSWVAYIRVGARDQRCTLEEEARFLRDASAETFDVQVLAGSSVADLDQRSLQWVRALYRDRHPAEPLSELSDEDFLDELGLRRDGALTHGAALLFGRRKLLARLKPGGLVDFRLIHGRWTEEQPEQRYDDRHLSEENLISTLRKLIERFLSLVPSPFALDDGTMQREAHPPEYRALREALVNLLGHQDYADQHRTARVLWFEDRTVFENPGDSFVSTADLLQGGASDLRNPRIVRLLRQIGFAEQAGSGLPTIVRTWREVDRAAPLLENDPAKKLFRLSLLWERVPRHEDAFWKQRLGVSVSPEEARLLDWLRRVEAADRRTARLATGSSARETQRMLEHLLANALIEPTSEGAESVRLAPHLRQILAESVGSTMPGGGPTDQVTEQATDYGTEHVTDQVTEQVAKLLVALHDVQGSASATTLLQTLGLRHRPTFLHTYLRPALDAGLIEPTIPAKPKSSRQQYRLTAKGRAARRALPKDRR